MSGQNSESITILECTKMNDENIKKYKIKLTFNLEELDAIDDLLLLHLDGEVREGELTINREALLRVQEQVDEVMAVVDEKLGFVPSGKSAPKFLM